jgi:hypothetical protein
MASDPSKPVPGSIAFAIPGSPNVTAEDGAGNIDSKTGAPAVIGDPAVSTTEDEPVTIPASALATGANPGAALTITGVTQPTYGKVTIAPDGQSLTYTPTTLDYEVGGNLTDNRDSFQYVVAYSSGGEIGTVTVTATPAADPPKISIEVLPARPGDPATLTRIEVTAISADDETVNRGSDYIQSLGLDLAGNVTSGVTITDRDGLLSGNTITPIGQPGVFKDEINILAPADQPVNDTLAITANNAETEGAGTPAVASKTLGLVISSGNGGFLSTVTTPEDQPVTIPISALATGAATITSVTQPQYGTVTIAPNGRSLTYNPAGGSSPLDYAVDGKLTGDQTSFLYEVNGAGGRTLATITVAGIPVAEPPTVSVKVLPARPGDPATLTRLEVTATSADDATVNRGSDYIQSLRFSGLPAGVTLSTPDTITPSGQPGTFSQEVDVTAPSGRTTNFNLGVTAVSAETEGTGSPATASASTSQNIDVDYSTISQNPNFQAVNQSIWGPGSAFVENFDKFLGIDYPDGFPASKPASKSTTALGVTFGGSLGLKTGLQADLNVNSGSFNGALPFNVTLNDTYNKTNDTLAIDPSETQLGGGSFATTGAGGSLDLSFIFDAYLKAYASAGGLGSTTLGPYSYNKTIHLGTLKSSDLGLHVPFPEGLGELTLAWPQVNTKGSSATPGAISATGASHPAIATNIDPIAVAFALLDLPDPFKFEKSFGPFGAVSLKGTLLAGTFNPGIGLQQTFDLSASGLAPTLTAADGTQEPLKFGTPLVIDNASSHNTTPGPVNFTLGLTPNATLSNDTSLAGQLVLGIRALAASISVPLVGEKGVGPLINPKTTLGPAALFSLYKNTFPVAFQNQNINLSIS